MAETLAELVAKIVVDADELKKGLASAEKDVKGLGKSVDKESKSIKDRFLEIGKAATVMGATITASMGLAIRSFVKTGSELNDLSLKTGVSVEALAGLKYAAEQNGASLGTVEMAIRRTASALTDAEEGMMETKRAFDRMGLSLKDLKGLKPEDQFLAIAEAIANIPDPMTRAATAVDLFGRSGTEMLPMLSKGADGLRRMMDEGIKANKWTQDGAQLADELGDAFGKLKENMTGVFTVIGTALAPALKDITKSLTDITVKVADWLDKNPALTKALGTATIAVSLFATAVGVASMAVKAFGRTTTLYFGGILLAIGVVVTGIMLLIEWFQHGETAANKLAAQQQAALKKQRDADKKYFANKRGEAQKMHEDALAKIREEYGENKESAKSLIEIAKDVRDSRLRFIKDEEQAARNAHKERLSLIEEEYRASLSAEQRKLQDQIDAIDKQTATEDLAITRRSEQERLADLKSKVGSGETDEEIAKNKANYSEYAEQIARKEIIRTRDVEQEALREKIQQLRDETGEAVVEFQKIRDEKIAAENMAHETVLGYWEKERTTAETNFNARLKEIATLKEKAIEAEGDKLKAALTTIASEEQALRESYGIRLNDTHKFVNAMNAETARLESRRERGITTRDFVPTPGLRLSPAEQQFMETGKSPFAPGFAEGGIVTQPTLAMIGESGAEAVVPLDRWAMPNIVINVASFTANSVRDLDTVAEKLVQLIRSRTGIR